jgi:hypothetical protein
MKKNYPLTSYIVFCFALLTFHSFAQAPSWQWAKNGSGINVDKANSVAVDGFGNSFITGFFESPAITFGSVTLTNASSGSDLFLVKYDPAGNLIWAKREGGTGDEVCNSVTVDALGNSFIAGYFESPSITFGTTTLTNNGFYDLFLVKYDPSGNVLWATSSGGNSSDYANCVSIDAAGNTYVTGNFQSPSIIFGSTTLTNAGVNTSDIFLVKYDPLGNVIWAKNTGGTDDDVPKSVSTDATGNSYIAGYYLNTTTIGSTAMTSNGFDDLFVAKLDPSGNVLWATSAGGNNRDQAYSVAFDAAGNSYVTGHFVSSSIVFGSTTLTNSASYDLFVVKYNPSGNALWAKNAGEHAPANGNSIAVDPSGNSYVAGNFADTTITIGTTILYNHDATGFTADMFLTKLDAAGNVLWAKNEQADAALSVCIDGSGNGYVAGYFNALMVTFGSATFINANNTGKIGDVFIAKIGKDIDGINSLENSNSNISLFPNPSSGIFHLQINNGNFPKSEIEIYDVLGNIIFQSEILNSETEINLSGNAKGIYFYRVMNENGILGTGKIMVE